MEKTRRTLSARGQENTGQYEVSLYISIMSSFTWVNKPEDNPCTIVCELRPTRCILLLRYCESFCEAGPWRIGLKFPRFKRHTCTLCVPNFYPQKHRWILIYSQQQTCHSVCVGGGVSFLSHIHEKSHMLCVGMPTFLWPSRTCWYLYFFFS